MSDFEKTHVGIIGNEGRFGSRMHQILQTVFEGSNWVRISGTDSKSSANTIDAAREYDVLVMATSIENAADTNREYLEALAEDGIQRVYININSVQNSGREALVNTAKKTNTSSIIVNIHPYFGPQTELSDARLIFSGVDCVDGELNEQLDSNQITENWKLLIEHLATTLPKLIQRPDAKPMRVIDLSQKELVVNTGERISGTQLHDYIAALTQAPYHILRLRLQHNPALAASFNLPDLDLTETKSTLSLAEAVVAQNPYAQELNTSLGDPLSKDTIQKWLREIHTRYDKIVDADPELNFVTNNVKNLFQWLE